MGEAVGCYPKKSSSRSQETVMGSEQSSDPEKVKLPEVVLGTIMSFAVHGLDETEITKMQEISPEIRRAIIRNRSLFPESCILEIRDHPDNSINGIWHLEPPS